MFIRTIFFIAITFTVPVKSNPQYDTIVIYDIDSNQNKGNTNPYPNNPFLSSFSGNVNYPETTTLRSASCDSYWSYQNDFFENWGQIMIPEPHFKKNIIRITLSLASRLNSRYVGEISLLKDRQSTVNDIANGLPIYYRVRFPIQNPVPKLTAIYYNDQLICSGPKDIGPFVTTITLDHTLFTGLTHPPQRPSFFSTRNPETTQPTVKPTQFQTFVPQPSPLFKPQPSPLPAVTSERPNVLPITPQNVDTNNDRFSLINDFECGVREYKPPTVTGLIVGGQNAHRGQFPWLAAYYHNSDDFSGFICGGSLISTKIVVTAAHCISEKHSTSIRKPEEATFYLGKHNLESLSAEKFYIVSAVTQFIIHSDWNLNNDKYDADIAIAVLSRKIPFNKFIKPICLWTSTTDTIDLVGKEGGIVAGWGKTEQNAISTSSPRWTKVPVVDLLTCIRSNDAFNKLTSDRTFCAGDRVGDTGPCSGDSGGGYVYEVNNKWYLRGIVSSALYDQQLGTCDSKNYAVFTDVSKFSSWLQRNVQSYG